MMKLAKSLKICLTTSNFAPTPLLKAVKQESYEEYLTAVTEFYTSDFDAAPLKLHLDVLASNFPVSLQRDATVMDVRKHIYLGHVVCRKAVDFTSSHIT